MFLTPKAITWVAVSLLYGVGGCGRNTGARCRRLIRPPGPVPSVLLQPRLGPKAHLAEAEIASLPAPFFPEHLLEDIDDLSPMLLVAPRRG